MLQGLTDKGDSSKCLQTAFSEEAERAVDKLSLRAERKRARIEGKKSKHQKDGSGYHGERGGCGAFMGVKSRPLPLNLHFYVWSAISIRERTESGKMLEGRNDKRTLCWCVKVFCPLGHKVLERGNGKGR